MKFDKPVNLLFYGIKQLKSSTSCLEKNEAIIPVVKGIDFIMLKDKINLDVRLIDLSSMNGGVFVWLIGFVLRVRTIGGLLGKEMFGVLLIVLRARSKELDPETNLYSM